MDNYAYYKFVQFLIFNEHRSFETDEEIKNFISQHHEEILNNLGIIIVENYTKNYLNDAEKDRIFSLLFDLRQYGKINEINELVILLNGSNSLNRRAFLKDEFFKRIDIPYLRLKKESTLDYFDSDLTNSISNDFETLQTHRKEISEENFVCENALWFIKSHFYFDSINAILSENPIILSEDGFKNKVINIIQINDFLVPSVRKDESLKYFKFRNKRLLKKITKG